MIDDPPASSAALLVWGAGAMGGSIGASLVRKGFEVVFVDKVQEHVRAMNEKGLRITGPVEDFAVPVRSATPNELGGKFESIFLCVKAHHTREATEQLKPHLREDGVVVSIQNGLCELEIGEVVGHRRTVGAFVNFGADYVEPGVIHRGNRGATVVGEIDGAITDRSRRLHEILRAFEPDAILTDNIFGFLWGKLAYASLLFATALTDASIADVLAESLYRPALISLAHEAVGVAHAHGISLEGFDGFDPTAFAPGESASLAHKSLDDLVAFNRASAKTHSGIWRDLAVRRRPTEVDAQLGWIVRKGREAGVDTPLTECVIRQIHEIEEGRLPLGWENLDTLSRILP
jgi:2-dehydropantoate 2-reductase